MDVPTGVTQEEDHSGFLHLTSAVLTLFFLARRIQPFLSLVDREVECCLLINRSTLVGHIWAYKYIYVLCFLPIHSGHQVRWTYQPGSHRRKVTQDF